jgi:curved DNA-binding protein CbpA
MSVYLQRITRPITSRSCLCFLISPGRSFSTKQTSSNHYDVLGIKSNATAKEVKSAFYRLSKKHHPDVNPNDINAAKKFSVISNAYDTLGDPVKRRDYDTELLSHTSNNDPYVTYNRTSAYAQRARAHRPSSWKPPSSSSRNASGGFQGAEGAFGSSRTTNSGDFDRSAYDAAFGRFRGPTPTGRSNIYDFDEFYRAHYTDFKSWADGRKEAKEQANRAQKEAEELRRTRANRSPMAKLSIVGFWLVLGISLLMMGGNLHDMHFQRPSNEPRAQFYLIEKPTNRKLPSDASTKS